MQNFIPEFVEARSRSGEHSGSLKGTVLFVDVSGFTALTEYAFKMGDAGAEVMSRELTRVFDPMVESVHKAGGFIANFAGDAFTAVFPEGKSDGAAVASRAVGAAHEITAYFRQKATSKTRHGDFRFSVKCGLERGKIEWGTPATEDGKARTWYFRGKAIDGAADAEHEAAKGKIELGPEIKKTLEGYKAKGGEAVTPSRAAAPDKALLDSFFATEVVEAGERAELRHVVSCFLHFEGAKTHEQIEAVFRELVEQLRKHGGNLNKLLFGDKGFTALAFFGAPRATENAESNAVGFAQAFRSASLPKLGAIKCRIGIDAGLCYAGIVGGAARNEWSCIGDAVNTSARLMQAAERNASLVSARVKTPAEKNWEFTSRGTFEFKGKAQKEEAFEPKGKRGSMRGFVYRNPMLGRDKELAQLTAFVEPLFSSEPRFAGITRLLGEPGLGKTRLVAALRASLEEKGRPFHWLNLPCDGVHRSGWNAVSTWLRSFFLVTEGMPQPEKKAAIERRYAEYADDTRIPEYTRSELKRTMSFAADLVDCHWDDSPFAKLDDPKLRHENRIIAIKELVRALGHVAPVIIEIEDTHWLDASTAAWLTAMTRNVAKLPLAIVATSRFADDGSKPALEIAQDTSLQDVELQPITGDDFTQSMARALLGADVELDTEALRLVAGKAKGNPFFTEQLILHLNETGELVPAGTKEHTEIIKSGETAVRTRQRMKVKSTDTARLPGSLSSLVTARIDRLAPEVRETVKHASILGVRFLSRVLGELLKRSGAVTRSLDEILLETQREGVLVPADEAPASPDKK
ncbi:MAG: AAA family ATPase [Planctomycetaceae bacterium]|nr:hypothetical protein [Planctomycetota bacterium]NUO16554.1 AAA family ATPase [Planctomycetaceae bacterium]GIK51815.1 MAG: hypothetical protein BroJett014_07880 [Planctomycetota bacterium]